MRVQLIAVLLVSTASAQDRVSTGVQVYDDGDITVVSPGAQGSVTLGDVRVDAGYAIDVLSGATPAYAADLVSSATRLEEVRHQGDLGVTLMLRPELRVSANLGASVEPDHQTWMARLGLEGELWDGMTVLTARWTISAEDVRPATGEPTKDRNGDHTVDLSAAWILTPSTTLTLMLTGGVGDCGPAFGCQANPYRFVAVDSDVGRTAARERHPQSRVRGAGAVRVSQRLLPGFALHVGYRYYHDSWDVLGHTGSVAVAATMLRGRLFARFDGRISDQTAASFFEADAYRSDAGTHPAHRTGDLELADLTGGGIAHPDRVRAGLVLAVGARASRLFYRYHDVPRRARRDAWVGGATLSAEL